VRRRNALLTLADVINAPELALIEVLGHAAHVVRVALIAQHPHLLGDEHGQVRLDDDPVAQCASQIIDRAVDLSAALRLYRRAIADAHQPDEDFPF